MPRNPEAANRAREKYAAANKDKIKARQQEIRDLKRLGLWPPPPPTPEQLVAKLSAQKETRLATWRRAHEKNREKERERAREYARAHRAERKEYAKRYREEHAEKHRQAVARSHGKHKDRRQAYALKRKQQNPNAAREASERYRRSKGMKPKKRGRMSAEEAKAYQQRYYSNPANKQRHIAAKSKWAKDHPGYFEAASRKRRAHKNGIPGSHTEKQWRELCQKFDHRCVKCGAHKSRVKLSRDHVIPISNPLSSDDISNIQPLCKPCNSSKGNRETVDYRRTPFTGTGQAVMFA